MSVSYYIYYRVVPAEAARARALIEAVQASLQQDMGILGRLLRRSDDASTWMEIYEAVDDTPRFESVLDRLLEKHDFTACLAPDSQRHVERFVPV